MSRRAGLRLRWTALLLLVLTACSASEPEPSSGVSAGEQAIRQLLTVADLTAAGVRTDGLEPRVQDLRAVAGAVDIEQVRESESSYSMRFQLADFGTALNLFVTEYDSPERATRQLDVVESGPAFDPMAQPVGDRSAWAGPGERIAVLAFVRGRHFVLVGSQAPDGAEALVDAAQLEALARLVEGRL